MSLYRLDYLNAEGHTTASVEGWGGRDFLSSHMTTARRRAAEAASETQTDVLVSRIGKAGAIRGCLIVTPDGSAKRPPGSAAPSPREDCTADDPESGPCFCSPCRAARRNR